MKRHLLSVVTGLFCVTPMLQVAAQSLYFDTNGATPGSGNANGLWQGTNWTADSTGGVATVAFSGTDTNLALFSAGTDGIGTLTVTQNANFDPNGITVEEGNILLEPDAVATNRTLTLTGDTVNVPGSSLLDFNVTLVSPTAVTLTGGGAINLGGAFDNAAAAVTVSGAGTSVLFEKASSPSIHATGAALILNAGTNGKLGGSFTGTIPTGLPANYTDQLLNSANITVDGTLDLAGFSEQVNDINGTAAGVITNSAAGTVSVINGNNGGTFNGTLQDGAGILALRKSGGGTLTIAGTANHTGGTTLAGGSLRFSQPATATASLASNNVEFTGGGILENFGAFNTLNSNLGTAVGEFRFTGNGGFSASAGTALSITLNGGATLTHGITTSFLAGNQSLTLGNGNANRTATLINNIDFGNTNAGDTLRRFTVNNGNANIEGELTGSLTGNGSLLINGQGALLLSNTANKYTGVAFLTDRAVLAYNENTLGAALGVYAMHSGQASNNNTNYSAVAYTGQGAPTAAFYNTIINNGYAVTQALINHSNDAIDFNNAPAALREKLSLGAVQFNDETSTDPLRAVTFTGTIAPVNNNVRLGGGGGILALDTVNAVSGQSNLIIRDNGSVLINNKGQNYTGTTSVDGGTLVLFGDAATLSTTGVNVNSLNGVGTGTATVATPTGTAVVGNATLRNPSGSGTGTAGYINSGLREGALVIRAKGDLIGAAPLTLNGSVLLARDHDNTPGNVVVQNVTLGNGFSQIAHQPQGASATSVDRLTINSLTRTFGATSEFRSQYGSLGVAGDSGRITVTNVDGAPITSTNGIIGGWATASTANPATTNTSFGRTFATLAGGELSALTIFDQNTAAHDLNLATATQNWLVNGGATAVNRTLTTSVSVNSIIHEAGGATVQNTLVNDGALLTLSSGGILFRNRQGSTSGANNFITSTTPANPGQITSSYVAPGSTTGELFLTSVENADNRLLLRITDNGATPVALVKSGFGNVLITRDNTFTGGVFVNAGELSLDHRDSTGGGILNNNTVTVRAGSRLTFLMGNATAANQDRSYGNSFTLNGGTLRTANTAANSGGNLTLTGTLNVSSLANSSAVLDPNNARRLHLGPAFTLTGSGNLVKTGDAALEIQTANTSGFTGNLSLSSGFIDLTGAGKLPVTNVVFSGGSMNINTTNQVVASLAGYGGGLQGTSGGTDSFETQQSINTAFHGNITNTNLILSGSGTLLLGGTGDNASAGIDVRSGTLILGKASSLAGARSVGTGFLLSGGTIRLDGTYTGDLPVLDNLQTEANLVDQAWQAVSPTITGGTLDLNSRSESLNLLNGTGGTITNQGMGLSRLYLGQTGGGTGNFSGLIQDGTGGGTVGLSKIGTGIQILSGTNTYSGTTNVAGGTLRINGNQSAATGALTVVSGATLGGDGTVGGPVTVRAGGFLSPGTAIGTFTTGPVVLEGALLTAYNDSEVVRIDKLQVNGNLTLDPSSELQLQALGTFPSGVQVIASYTGSLSGTFGTITGLPAGYTVDYAYNDGISPRNIALVADLSSAAYTAWATTNGLAGADAASGADPDKDGKTNIEEFALDGDPNSALDSGKSRVAITAIGGDHALTLTIPVRAGATFTGATAKTAPIDGISYTVEGSDDLAAWNTLIVTEITAAAAGLPALNPGWTYRTFRTPDTVNADNRDFLRVRIAPGS